MLVVIEQCQKERHQISHDRNFIIYFPIQVDGLLNDLVDITQIGFVL